MFRKIENKKIKCSKSKAKKDFAVIKKGNVPTMELPEDGDLSLCFTCNCFISPWGDYVECKYKGE